MNRRPADFPLLHPASASGCGSSALGVASPAAIAAVLLLLLFSIVATRAAVAAPPPAADATDHVAAPDDSDDDDDEEDDDDTSDRAAAGDADTGDAVGLSASLTPGEQPVYDLRPYQSAHPELAAMMGDSRAGRAARVMAAWARMERDTDAELRAAAGWIAFRSAQRAGREQDAHAVLQALSKAGPLADRARIELGRLALAKNDVAAAVAAFSSVQRNHADATAIRLEAAALLLDTADFDAADAAMRDLAGARLRSAQRATLLLLRGDLHRRRGARDAAVAAYLAAWRLRRGASSEAALERLVVLGHAPTPLEQVMQLLKDPSLSLGRSGHATQRKAALAEIDDVAACVPGLADFAHAAVDSHDRGRRDEVLALLQRSLTVAAGNLAAHAGLIRGDLLGKLGRDAEAIETLEAAMANAQDPAILARIRWRLQRLYDFVGRGLDAERLLNALVEKGPGTRYSLLALWALAWRRFQLGDLAEAEHLLVRIEGSAGGTMTGTKQPWRAKAGYWLGRIAALNLAKTTARARFLEVARRWPQSYYGLLAADRLGEIDPGLAIRLAGSAPPSASGGQALRVDEVRLVRTPGLGEIVIYVRLGDLSRARRALRGRLADGLPAGAVQLLAALYAADGHDRSALGILRRYVRRAGPPATSTLSLWRAAFPTPWAQAFERAATDSGVPRSVIYAIARTESAFNERAQSHAGAVGLTQLLPKVASKIAGLWQLHIPSRSALLKAETNVAIGARYLAELSRMYQGNHALVAAAYNAGPYATRRWLGNDAPVPTDVFVESLPSGGARAYAMSILSTAATYALLYPDWQELAAVRLGRPAMVPSSLGPFMTGKRIASSQPAVLLGSDKWQAVAATNVDQLPATSRTWARCATTAAPHGERGGLEAPWKSSPPALQVVRPPG